MWTSRVCTVLMLILLIVIKRGEGTNLFIYKPNFERFICGNP